MEAFQRRHAEALKDHEEWLQAHGRAMSKHAQAMADADETEKSLKALLYSLRKRGNGGQGKT